MRVSFAYILVFSLIIFNQKNCFSKIYGNHKDTVKALVLNEQNPLFNNLSELSGKQIMGMIDSLLNLDKIPKSILKKLNDFAEKRVLKDDYYNSITYFNDDSKYPSNAIYKKWDTKSISPYKDISQNDTNLYLKLLFIIMVMVGW